MFRAWVGCRLGLRMAFRGGPQRSRKQVTACGAVREHQVAAPSGWRSGDGRLLSLGLWCFSKSLGRGAHGFGSRLSFQGCLCSKSFYKLEIVSPSRGREQICLLSCKIKTVSPGGQVCPLPL